MKPTDGARTFLTSGDAYDSFMGRYSGPLAADFIDLVGVVPGIRALDIGCGPGALTHALAARLGPRAVDSCDPSPPFVAECAARNPGVDVKRGSAEELPYESGAFDAVLAQLVMHFVSEPTAAIREMSRVAKPGALLGASVWDFERGMEMLRAFWDAAITLDPAAPDELRVMRFGRLGELAELFEEGGLAEVTEQELVVATDYVDFDELWRGFLAGIGPAGNYLLTLHANRRAALKDELYGRLGSPTGCFRLHAVARAALGIRPD